MGEEEWKPDEMDRLNHLECLGADSGVLAVDHEGEFQGEADQQRSQSEHDEEPAEREQNASGLCFDGILDPSFAADSQETDDATAKTDRRRASGARHAADRLEAHLFSVSAGDLETAE